MLRLELIHVIKRCPSCSPIRISIHAWTHTADWLWADSIFDPLISTLGMFILREGLGGWFKIHNLSHQGWNILFVGKIVTGFSVFSTATPRILWFWRNWFVRELRLAMINLLWSNNAIWHHRTGSTLAWSFQAITWTNIDKSLVWLLWHLHEGNFNGNAQDISAW